MKKKIFTLIYFLSLAYYTNTTGYCMDEEEYVVDKKYVVSNIRHNHIISDKDYSERHSLISGIDYFAKHWSYYSRLENSDNFDKAAITVGMGKIKNGLYHAYLVFEHLEGDKIKLTGVDMRTEDGRVPYVNIFTPVPANTDFRSHKEVIKDFVRYKKNGQTCDTKMEKIASFIVPKENALTALDALEELRKREPMYCTSGAEIQRHFRSAPVFNCFTYAINALAEAGIKLPSHGGRAMDKEVLETLVKTCALPQGVRRIFPLKDSLELLEKAQETVPLPWDLSDSSESSESSDSSSLPICNLI